MKENCDLRTESGRCRKYDARETCKKNCSSREWFDDELLECEIDEVCRRSSIFGNGYYKITKKQLEALKNGKVLFTVGEYGTFLILEE